MKMKTKQVTYKTGLGSFVTTTKTTVVARQGAHEIDCIRVIGRYTWVVSWAGTGLVEVDDKETAETCAFYVSKHTNGDLDNMRELARSSALSFKVTYLRSCPLDHPKYNALRKKIAKFISIRC